MLQSVSRIHTFFVEKVVCMCRFEINFGVGRGVLLFWPDFAAFNPVASKYKLFKLLSIIV